ncbi:MAG: hypothetical protein R2880_00360 [Deinococcales bacterium]
MAESLTENLEAETETAFEEGASVEILALNASDTPAVTANQFQSLATGFNALSRLSWAADQDLLTTLDRQRGLALWDMRLSQPRAKSLPVANQYGEVTSFALGGLSQESLLLATGSRTGVVNLWTVTTRSLNEERFFAARLKQTLNQATHLGAVSDMIFSRDGRLLISASERSGEVFLWDSESGALLEKWHHGTGAIIQLAFNDDESLLAAASADGSIGLWELASGQARANLNLNNSGSLQSILFIGQDKILAAYRNSLNEGTLRLWQGDKLLSEALGRETEYLALLDDELIASAHRDGSIMLWQFNPELRPLRELQAATNRRLSGLVYVSFTKILVVGYRDGLMELWPLSE